MNTSKKTSTNRQVAYQTLDEEMELRNLDVQGEIPTWLDGSLFRNGPAKFETANEELNHWFDGYAMLHLFSISDGQVEYRNKFLRTESYRSASSGKMEFTEFGTDPCRDIFERFFTYFLPPKATDNANVNIGKIAQDYVAMTETPMPIRFDPKTLETLGVKEYESPDGQMTTAHPHYDPDEEATLNYVTKFSWNNQYEIFRVPDNGDSDNFIGTVPVQRPSYMHSFGMSENYIILTEFPLTVNPLNIVIGNGPLINAFEWEPDRGTRFTVVNKSTGDLVTRLETDLSFFAFHHVNAFERDDELIIDMVTYEDASVIEEFYLDNIRSDEFSPDTAELSRYSLSLTDQTVQSRVLSPEPIELPRINYERYNTCEYQYVYGVGQKDALLPDQLIKIDVNEGVEATWDETNTFAGEPVFVENPNPDSEDDGVVLSVMIDADNEKSFLVVLDAESFEEMARVEVPHVIPNGFHGQFYSDE